MGKTKIPQHIDLSAFELLRAASDKLSVFAKEAYKNHCNCLEYGGAEAYNAFLHSQSAVDEARMGEHLLFDCCNALESAYRLGSPPPPGKPGEALDRVVSLKQYKDEIILKTPYLKKAANRREPQPWECLIYGTLAFLDLSLFAAKQIIIHVLSVYPRTVDATHIHDADNIDIKALGDPITQKLGIDDNALDVNVCIGAVISDRIQPGSYMIIRPRSKSISTTEALEKRLRNTPFSL